MPQLPKGEAWAQEISEAGLTEKSVVALVTRHGMRPIVVRRDEQSLGIVVGYDLRRDMHRACLEVDNGIVTKVEIG